MKFAGIITEYDPFHNGHAAQLAAARRAGAACIAVCMSSGAVQRGGVPILPDAVRARAALEAGADLVVALWGVTPWFLVPKHRMRLSCSRQQPCCSGRNCSLCCGRSSAPA